MLRFALDQNFPTPVVNALAEYLGEAELVSIRQIDPRRRSFGPESTDTRLGVFMIGAKRVVVVENNSLVPWSWGPSACCVFQGGRPVPRDGSPDNALLPLIEKRADFLACLYFVDRPRESDRRAPQPTPTPRDSLID